MKQTKHTPGAHRFAVACFFFIGGISFASWASRIPHIKASLQLSEAGLGGVLFALPVGLMVSLPFSGWIVTRWGSKKSMLLASITYPIILLLIGSCNSVLQLVICLFCFGFFGNLMNIAVNTQAVGVEIIYQKPIMASFHGVWSAAGFAGAAFGTLMVSLDIPPFNHFLIMAISMILLAFLMQGRVLSEDKANKSQPFFAKPDALLLKLGLIAFSSMVCEGTMFDWSGIYFQKVVKAAPELTTTGYAAFMFTMAGGRFLGDKLVLKLGIKKMLEVSGILISCGLMLAILFPYLSVATLGFLTVGLGVSSVIPIVYGQAGKSSSMPAGAALAAVSTIGFLGFLIGPPVIGFIAETAGLQWSFLLIAILGLGTTLLAGITNFKV